MVSRLIIGCFICAFCVGALNLPLAAAGEKPSREYEREVQPGGAAALSRYEDLRVQILRRPHDWKVPPKSMRKYHDLVGLPDDYRSPITIGGEKLRISPESIKTSVSQAGGSVNWEVWRLELQREGISWMAEFFKRWPLPEPLERGFHYKQAWTIDPVQNTPLGWDASFQGMEELRVGENPYLSYTTLGARPLVHWRVYRQGARYFTPRLKLSDLKKYCAVVLRSYSVVCPGA